MLLLVPLALLAQSTKNVLVVTAGAGDYLMSCGGTLANLIDQGYAIYVVQFGNDEKNSVGMTPAETRLANSDEGGLAARMLGVKEVVNLNHKSGELSQVSSNTLREEIIALVRLYKPQIIFHPDPWVHYEPDWDQYWVARATEEYSYGGGAYFAPELTKLGFPGVGVRETYYYAAHRPYRPGEGGGKNAPFKAIDITTTFNRKVAAIQELRTANHRYAVAVKQRLDLAGKPSPLLAEVNEATTRALVRAYAEELAEAIGKKHGFRYGEEFNYNGPGGGPIPEHVLEHAKPIP